MFGKSDRKEQPTIATPITKKGRKRKVEFFTD
jgi:hypothetical protein